MEKPHLRRYVIAVCVVLAIANIIAVMVCGSTKANPMPVYSGGFLMGMFAMYIAVHRYRWK